MPEALPEGQMLFTLKEVSSYLKVSLASLHRWRRGGVLQAHKVGKQWRVPRDELSRLAGAQHPPTAPTPRMVMPDPDDLTRHPWVGLIERGDLVEFLELRVLKMALEAEHDTTMRALLEGFTTHDLEQYRSALLSVLSLTDRILDQRPQE